MYSSQQSQYHTYKTNWNRPNTKGILLNVQTVKHMGTKKIIAISNPNASNAQVTTRETNATGKNDLVMSHVFSVVLIIL
jgi:hypothetical protein